jgi:hypothetical protein
MMLPRPVLHARPRDRAGSARVRRDHRSSGLWLCALAQPANAQGGQSVPTVVRQLYPRSVFPHGRQFRRQQTPPAASCRSRRR